MSEFESIHKKGNKTIVLFIHGFTGSKETWVNNNKIELPNLLLEDEIISDNLDFAYLSYYTELMDFYGTKIATNYLMKMLGLKTTNTPKNLNIQQISDFIYSVINYNCSQYENIIIVAHSMGGIVAKSIILEELKKYSISNKFKLFLSLAVPHNGTDWGKIGENLFKNRQAIDLQPLSKTLTRINNDWVQQKTGLPKTVYFYGQFDEVVDESSAISYQYEIQDKVPCDDNHFSITRPDTKNRHVFRVIQMELIDFVSNIQQTETLELKEFIDVGQLDDETFVIRLLIADVHNVIINNAKQTFFNAEYMRKVVVNQGDGAISKLTDLYQRIEAFYTIAFGKLLSRDLKDGSHLVTYVHDNLVKDNESLLKCSIPIIGGYQKMGMMHQLANKMEKDIWWARENNIQSIEEYRKKRLQ